MSNDEVPNLAPPISSKGSCKSTGNQGKVFSDVAETSNHSQNSANPNPKCQNKKIKNVDKASPQTCTGNTGEQRREWAEMQEEEGG